MRNLFMVCLMGCAPLATADALRDPTRPPIAAHAESVVVARAPVLSAILGSKWDRAAIFNGKLVRSGETVGGYAIEAVFDDGVRYRHAGISQELYLPHSAGFKKLSTAAARAPMGDH